MNQTKTALITGASGGIGRALCCEFAGRGYRLVITGRNPARLRRQAEKLEEAFGAQVYFIAADLGVKGAARELCARLDKKGERIDVLVNNAGFGLYAPFAQNKPELLQEMLCVNINSLTWLCSHYLPSMVKRGEGKILNVSSIGGFVPSPGSAVYCATKSYVLSLSQALAEECAGSGVTVTALCPGATRSGFARRAEMEDSPLFHLTAMNPAQVAAAAYRGLMEGRPVVVPGLHNKVAHALSRVIPGRLAAKASGRALRPNL